MAHQAHSIPWHTLADNLIFRHCSPRNLGVTNLYLRKARSHQNEELRYFIIGFVRALSSYSVIERRKYDASPVAPALDEEVISPDAVRKMAGTILRYKGRENTNDSPRSLDDVLSTYERTVQRFISDTQPGEGDMHDGIRDVCEQTKTMLLYGEMDLLFRLAAHPSVWFSRLWDESIYANAGGFGLSKLKDSALQAYICLNVISLKPELYDAKSREAFIREEIGARRTALSSELYDYRLTAAYQQTLMCCTGTSIVVRHYEVHTFPHRDFFGIPCGMYRSESSERLQRSPLGTTPLSGLAEPLFRGVHVASRADFAQVLNLLRAKRLPSELALEIMCAADYTSVGRTYVRDDPLHVANAKELKKYLSYCWKLLVRLDMLWSASGMRIDWEAEVAHAVRILFEITIPRQ